MLLPPFHLCAAPASAATVDPTAEYRNMPIIRNYPAIILHDFSVGRNPIFTGAVSFTGTPYTPIRRTLRGSRFPPGSSPNQSGWRAVSAAPEAKRCCLRNGPAIRLHCFSSQKQGRTVPVAILIKSLCSTGLSHNKRNLSGSIFYLLLIYESGSTKGLKNQGDFRSLSQKSVL